jgi:hypothetical protein
VYRAVLELLLLLRDYLQSAGGAAGTAGVAAAVLSVVGVALARVEHMLRSAGAVPLWPWPAVQVMDGLVQLYTVLLQQVRSVPRLWLGAGAVGVPPMAGRTVLHSNEGNHMDWAEKREVGCGARSLSHKGLPSSGAVRRGGGARRRTSCATARSMCLVSACC